MVRQQQARLHSRQVLVPVACLDSARAAEASAAVSEEEVEGAEEEYWVWVVLAVVPLECLQEEVCLPLRQDAEKQNFPAELAAEAGCCLKENSEEAHLVSRQVALAVVRLAFLYFLTSKRSLPARFSFLLWKTFCCCLVLVPALP